ncbi:hypothetical protein [Actinokineospora sp. NBRC 105648]|uniref:hypothetical protein n=1 Tax=Actinokineospora sp. NBRC 105648 TaxID=3032206 RepID=UPI0024A3A364|nr:hypothetical protein [Actinokineospora sp. NBRC 105648]GLZ40679.1 hypothetical protein Acsp05_43030 [Actinokineospora sp. NBRC 105648]
MMSEIATVASIVALAVVAVTKHVVSLRAKRFEETSRTVRLCRVIEGSSPHERPDIIRAQGELENRSTGDPAAANESDPAAAPAPAATNPVIAMVLRAKGIQ